jgi:superfamily II RNA helicase
MVKICSITNYPNDNECKYQEYFNKFNYPLHIFQKWAIEGIVEGHHVLVTSPTGSGKSLPAEFALDYFYSNGKKTIYCSPIKSLSNQKFNDFSQKYPHIRVGIVTGDVSCNPDADVIVMTTEILLNKLYQIKSNTPINSSVSFEMDIQNELGCVIFDEIHYIGNEERGMAWENSIMLLPRHVQMIGLSATLDNPEKFAYWVENRGELNTENNKIVYLTSKLNRAVPLIHYSFITATQTVFKYIRDKAIQEEIKSVIDKPWVIQDEKNKFNDENFIKINKMLKLFETKEIRIKRPHVLNQVTKYLTEHEMTPAICYVFSIKQLEICSKEVTTNLLEFDSKVPYIAKRECDKILREKFVNYEEYFHLPEYINLVALLEKGIATHHSKMLPVLREIVEIFFARGYIKLLFATESVAIGLNLPVKTCIFTDINKHDGTGIRILQGHEYVQAGGRAGRLGLDKVGHVIHLNNLFRNVESTNYKQMMNGKPQILTSKFKISYNLILNLLDIGDNDLTQFASKSMITGDLDNQMKDVYYKIASLQAELDNINSYCGNLRTPIEVINEYNILQNNLKLSVNKKRKEIERKIQNIKDNYKYFQQDIASYSKISEKEKAIDALQSEYNSLTKYFSSGVGNVLGLLNDEKFITSEEPLISEEITNSKSLKLTILGKIASQIREIHCLAFAKLYESNVLDTLSAKQLVALFSCFTNIRATDEFKDNAPKSDDYMVNEFVLKVLEIYDHYRDEEIERNINTNFDYDIQYDLLNFTENWCDAESVEECKIILQELASKKGIFLGEFVKALLKINNISSEFENIAEMTGNIAFLSKLREIPNMTLKYVVTNQSLYV